MEIKIVKGRRWWCTRSSKKRREEQEIQKREREDLKKYDVMLVLLFYIYM